MLNIHVLDFSTSYFDWSWKKNQF